MTLFTKWSERVKQIGQYSVMRIYGGEVATARSDRRRTALMDAAEELIGSGGTDRLALRRVCAQARLNDRYFYESFANVDELLAACFDRAISQTLEVLLGSMAKTQPGLRATTHAVVTTTLDHLLAHRASTAVLLAGRNNPALASRRRALITRVADLFVTQVALVQGSEQAASMATRLSALSLVNGELETLAMWLDGDVEASSDSIVEHLVEAIMGRLEHVPSQGMGDPIG